MNGREHLHCLPAIGQLRDAKVAEHQRFGLQCDCLIEKLADGCGTCHVENLGPFERSALCLLLTAQFSIRCIGLTTETNPVVVNHHTGVQHGSGQEFDLGDVPIT